LSCCLFFFQAEDGIRDRNVTGVQTCALPIYLRLPDFRDHAVDVPSPGGAQAEATRVLGRWLAEVVRRNPHNFLIVGPDETASNRSEERRVGKECRSRWWPQHETKDRGQD